MNKQDRKENYTNGIENSSETSLQLEYYKNKQNGIERHLDDALTIALSTLAVRGQNIIDLLIKGKDFRVRFYENGQPQYDPLEMKAFVKTSGLPSIETASSIEEYEHQVDDALDSNKRFERMFEGLTEAQVTELETRLEEENKMWNSYTEDINKKFYNDTSKIMSFGPQSVIMTPSPVKCVARINIKVPETISPYHVVMQLAEKLSHDDVVTTGGFQMKSLRGDSSDRDGVIIYATADSFKGICSILRDYFRNDYHYHDRNADCAIFGGVALEDSDGSKFPSIRVCAEPESVSSRLSARWTFNRKNSPTLCVGPC